MNLIAISELMHLISLLTNIGSTLLTEQDIWQLIGKLAAENAAKPSVDVVSLHE